MSEKDLLDMISCLEERVEMLAGQVTALEEGLTSTLGFISRMFRSEHIIDGVQARMREVAATSDGSPDKPYSTGLRQLLVFLENERRALN